MVFDHFVKLALKGLRNRGSGKKNDFLLKEKRLMVNSFDNLRIRVIISKSYKNKFCLNSGWLRMVLCGKCFQRH